MLTWIITFLVLAVIASLFGFGGIASAFAGVAQILAFIFIAIFIIMLIMHLARGRRPPA